LIFLTGGARSGKTALAARLVADSPSVRLIVTARADDDEMRARIRRHQEDRLSSWVTIEEPEEVVDAVYAASSEESVILDCVTIWVSNLMVEHDDDHILEQVGLVARALAGRPALSVVVSNEVGAGLVPMSEVGRRFRDLHGFANQEFSARAESAFLVVAGRSLALGDIPDVR
jgi:adenosylcobinamide kinase/adenosylcobinamide-phosphate guanylyltransferase